MMPTPKISRTLAQAALNAQAKHGTTAGAKALGITRNQMQARVRTAHSYGMAAGKSAAKMPTAAEVNASFVGREDELNKLRDEIIELKASLKARSGNTLDSEYVKRKIIGIKAQADDVQSPTWLVKAVRNKALPGVPVAMWSDWHWGEVVFPDQVNGVNEYNLEVAHARGRRLVERTIRLLRNHVVNPQYPGVVINLGGDMLSGDIHEELKESNDVPLLPALLDIFGFLKWALKTMADEFGNVFVPCVTGNHGRMSRKPQAKNRNFTNYDWLLYQLLAKHFENDKRITFFIPEGPDALYSVFGHKYLLTHGDQWRGGDGQIGAIGPITRGNMKKLARNSAINRDYDTAIIGHWHQYMPLHRTMVNGSLKGYDEYCNSNNFGFEPPIQAMWLTHPEHGIIMHLPIYLEPHPGRATDVQPWVQWKDGA